MEVTVVRNFLSEDLLELLNIQIEEFKGPVGPVIGVAEDREVFFRKEIHNPGLFYALYGMVQRKAKGFIPEPVKPSYVFVSMYEDDRSVCPLHTDREQCKYTVDVCLNQKVPWDIYINDVPYTLNPGDAVIYSGTQHPHYRKKITPGNFCDLAFFHFVPENFEGNLN